MINDFSLFHFMSSECFGGFLILEVVRISAFSCFSPAGQVLTFKELTWQTLRIEADATDNGDQDPITTPLRLITNQGRIQISLKRRVRVSSMLCRMWSQCLVQR